MSTVMQLDVSPVLHRYVLPTTRGVQSSLDSPSQREKSPVMVHCGSGLRMTSSLQTLKQPFGSVTVTE